MSRQLGVVELGVVPYGEAHALQRRLAERLMAHELDHDVLLLLEHERTITLGRGTRATSLPIEPGELARRGFTVAEVERGGDVTWHGPGQLVGYPILDLTRHRQDLHWYLRMVEEALITALGRLGIPGERHPGHTGVWTRGRKIASIGIHVRQWVTTHGFALNVSNDLADFGLIVPCGITGVEMTTVSREAGAAASRERTVREVVSAFGEVFGLVPAAMTLPEPVAEGTGRGGGTHRDPIE